MTVALIRTKDCEACNIMSDIMMKVVKDYAGVENISFIITYRDEIPDIMQRYIGLKDFPTIVVTPYPTYIFTDKAINCCLPKNSKEYFTLLEGVVPYTNITSAIEKYR